MRQHLLERFFAGANPRNLGLQGIDFAAQVGRGAAALDEIFFGATALASDGFELQLALREGFRKLLACDFQAFDFGGSHLLFACGARRFAVNAG